MEFTYRDFGKVGDKKRLDKATQNVIGSFFDFYNDDNDEVPEQISVSVVLNSFCSLHFDWDGCYEDDDKSFIPIEISINSNISHFRLVEIKWKLTEGHYWGGNFNIVVKLMEQLDKIDNLRAVKECRNCNNNPTLPTSQFCEGCDLKVCHHDEVCPICIDKEDTDNIWVETKCKHIFHSFCIKKYANQLIKDKTNMNCPLCRTELNVWGKTL